MRSVPVRPRVINGLTCVWNRSIRRWEVVIPQQRCFHCDIPIDLRFDEPHQVEIEGDIETICDSCHGDYLVYGEDFGDHESHRVEYWGGCPHVIWAEEERTIREGMSA